MASDYRFCNVKPPYFEGAVCSEYADPLQFFLKYVIVFIIAGNVAAMLLYFGSKLAWPGGASFSALVTVGMFVSPLSMILFGWWLSRNSYRYPCFIREASSGLYEICGRNSRSAINEHSYLCLIDNIEFVYSSKVEKGVIDRFSKMQLAIWLQGNVRSDSEKMLLGFAEDMEDATEKANFWMSRLGVADVHLGSRASGFPFVYRYLDVKKIEDLAYGSSK